MWLGFTARNSGDDDDDSVTESYSSNMEQLYWGKSHSGDFTLRMFTQL
jgi:hypothetical protein